jgi:putative ABC transport system ATP-binding protein
VYTLTGVTKLYHKGRQTIPAVTGLDLVIGDGEWLAVQGRTGHGKTTLLNLLGGLDRPTQGAVELDGTGLGRLPETKLTRLRAQSIGFIFHLQPDPHPGRGRERRSRPDPARHWPGGPTAPHRRGAGRRPFRPGRASARRAVRRPAAAGSDRPRPGQGPGGVAGRRAHRQPGEGTRDDIIGLLEHLWREWGLTLVLVTHDTVIARRAQRLGVVTDGHLTIRQDSLNH